MNPKFAVLQKLCSDQIEKDIEIGFTKIRYEVERKKNKRIEEEIERDMGNGKKRVKREKLTQTLIVMKTSLKKQKKDNSTTL